MENDELAHTRALVVEIKAEKGARGWSNQQLAEASGIPLGTINRMLSKSPREIYIRQIADLATAFGMTASELVHNAEKRFARMSAVSSKDELADRRRKQDGVASMSVDELERQKSAATRDAELDADEPDIP